MEFKACFKCGEVQPLFEFYAHPKMSDGHLNKCKRCARTDVKKHRRENDSVREYDRARGSRGTAAGQRDYRAHFPRKRSAQQKIAYEVRVGRLAPPDKCEVDGCDVSSLHAHHDDYAKPMEVRWLCALHHHRWHAEHGEAKNGD